MQPNMQGPVAIACRSLSKRDDPHCVNFLAGNSSVSVRKLSSLSSRSSLMEPEATEADVDRINGVGGDPGVAPPAADGLQPQAGAQPPLPTHAQYRDRPDLPDMPGYPLRHTLRPPGSGSGTAVACVRFDPAGHRLASGSNDRMAYIWDVDTGALLHTLEGHLDGISGACRCRPCVSCCECSTWWCELPPCCPADVAWTPDGRYLATASDDCTLRVWDAATGACLRILQGHSHFVFCCAFSRGSNLLVRCRCKETWPAPLIKLCSTRRVQPRPHGATGRVCPDGSRARLAPEAACFAPVCVGQRRL